MGAHVHRPNGHNSRDDEGVRDRIARIVASRPETLEARSHMYFIRCFCKLSQCLGVKCSPRARFGFGKHERECEVRWRRPDPTSSRRCLGAYRDITFIYDGACRVLGLEDDPGNATPHPLIIARIIVPVWKMDARIQPRGLPT